ncbi:hypothetical protein HDU98_006902 [Podochytrium sp. JEL0797]|nr:hypothetical protein HDU98_006902 [Podochytrium sp. JEL0797]
MDSALLAFFAPSAIPADQKAAVETIASSVSSSSSLLPLVVALQPFATAGDPFERAKAVGLLSQVLSQVEWKGIQRKEGEFVPASSCLTLSASVAVLLQFYIDRLHDITSVPELLSGIQSMLASGHVARPDAIELARSFFKELNVQNHAQTVRFSAYCIFELLLKSHLDAMKYLGDVFISGFLVAMDGEKDPRNILISFSIVQTIVINFDLTKKFDDVFESIYCYFPITFRPPANDPYGITSQDLKLKLRSCFSASPLFGTLAWPILIEKLSSASDNAKLDAMETIAACAPVYGGSSIGKNLEELWDHLREESLDAKPAAQKEAALSAITAVTYALSTDSAASSTSRDNLTKFLTHVEKYVLSELMDTTSPHEYVRKVLKATAKATEPAFFHLVSKIVKPFLDSLKGGNEAMETKAEKYGVFCDFLELAEGFYGDDSRMEDDTLQQNPLLPFKDDLYRHFSSALSSKNNRVIVAGLHGLSHLSTQRAAFLTPLELEWYFETLLGLVINENNTVRQAVIGLLSVESVRRIDMVLKHVVPQLLEACDLGAKEAEEPVLNALECLVALCGASGSVLCTVVPSLSKKVEDLQSMNRLRSICAALEIIFENLTSGTKELDLLPSLFVPLLRALVMRQVEEVALRSDLSLVESVGRIFASAVRLMDRLSQEAVAAVIVKALYTADTSDLGVSGIPVSIDAASNTRLLAIVFSSVLSNLRPETVISNVDVSAMLNHLTQESVFKGPALETVKNVYLNSLYEVIASMLNKGDATLVARYLQENDSLFKLLRKEQVGQSVQVRNAAIVLVLWITRALVMKKPSAEELSKVSQLIQLLNDSDGDAVASTFSILSADDASFGKHVLTKESFAKSSLLWKQKLFKHCLPILVGGFNGASSVEVKGAHLLALSHLMKYVTKSVILYEIQNLIPLLLAGLTSQTNPQLNHTILEIVSTLLSDAPDSLRAHLDSFTAALLRLSTESPNAQVRVLALKCVGQLAATSEKGEIRFSELFVLKPRVLKGLQAALDDGKKNVRKEAGEARAKWFLLLGEKK